MILRRFFLACVLLLPVHSWAVAMGDVVVRSALGQLLDADIDFSVLSAQEAESLSVRLAPADMFAEAGLDYGAVARSLRLSIEKKSGRPTIHLSSDKVITEPFLILLVEVSTGSNRSIRQYALLLDPPSGQEDAQLAVVPPVVSKLVTESTVSSSEASPKTSPLKAPNATIGRLAAKSASSEAHATTYQVKPGDTLRQIAASVQPRGATLAQVMIAIVQKNSEAFDEHNIHRMKADVVLAIPEPSVILAIDPQQAIQQVRSQTSDFNHAAINAKSLTPLNHPTKDVADNTPANKSYSGRVGKQKSNSLSEVSPKDQLKLSMPDQSAANKDAPESKALDTLADEKSLAESNSRIAELEKNIRELQDQLASRQAAPESSQQQAKPEPSTANSSALANADHSSAKPNKEIVKPAVAIEASNAFVLELENLVDVEKLLKEWNSESNVIVIIVGASSITALLLLLWLKRRQHRWSELSKRIEPEAGEGSIFGHAGGQHVDTNHSVFHSNFVPSVSQLDAKEVDAIAEADVYIAYGRDEQAEEILLDALRLHPERHALRIKLLEIYAARKDQKKFSHVASELRALTHAQSLEWKQAAQLGLTLDPTNPLYAGGLPDKSLSESSAKIANELISKSRSDNIHLNQADQTVQTLQTDQAVTDIVDFSLRLDEMLHQGQDNSKTVESSSSERTAEVIDFTQTGVTSRIITSPAEALALKTKIDLAMACNEIGDKEGARDLLAEVASSRHAELASRAKSLLQQLA